MGMIDNFLDWLGRRLATRLGEQKQDAWPYAPADPAALERALRPGDVVLVSGSEKVSTASSTSWFRVSAYNTTCATSSTWRVIWYRCRSHHGFDGG